MDIVLLLAGVVLGAGAVWFMERYHEKRAAELLNIVGQLQLRVDQLQREVDQLQEPPIPAEEM
mgnify:CR=1 FL=1